jgi:CBS domain-containing protein
MKARDLMTSNPACCAPEDTALDAARMMRDSDCGCIPVVDPRLHRTVGVVTDRDLAIRGLADGRDGATKVRDLMTKEPASIGPDAGIDEVERMMAEHQVRRVPVVDGTGMCIGIVSQADLARAQQGESVSPADVASVVRRISEPAGAGAARARGPRDPGR